MLKFTAEIQGLDTDFKSLNQRIESATEAGLKAVASDMQEALYETIQQDVYDAWKSNKKHPYTRRKSRGGMIDPKNVRADFTSKHSLVFNYTFPAEVAGWSFYDDGDDAIRAIQIGDYYPTETPYNVPPRPFWTNFFEDYIEDGGAEQSLVKGMNTHDHDLNVVVSGTTVIEARDRNALADLESVPNGSVNDTKNTYQDYSEVYHADWGDDDPDDIF